MKKFIFIFAILISTLSLTSCFDKSEDPKPATITQADLVELSGTYSDSTSYSKANVEFRIDDTVRYFNSVSTDGNGQVISDNTPSTQYFNYDNEGFFVLENSNSSYSYYTESYFEYIETTSDSKYVFKQYFAVDENTAIRHGITTFKVINGHKMYIDTNTAELHYFTKN